MAKAKETQIEVTTTVTGISLELTLDEATTLADIMSRVGGSPSTSRRGHTAAIYETLRAAGVKAVCDLENYDGYLPEDLEGALIFRENTPRLKSEYQ
jgi:hypothetical protein